MTLINLVFNKLLNFHNNHFTNEKYFLDMLGIVLFLNVHTLLLNEIHLCISHTFVISTHNSDDEIGTALEKNENIGILFNISNESFCDNCAKKLRKVILDTMFSIWRS